MGMVLLKGPNGWWCFTQLIMHDWVGCGLDVSLLLSHGCVERHDHHVEERRILCNQWVMQTIGMTGRGSTMPRDVPPDALRRGACPVEYIV